MTPVSEPKTFQNSPKNRPTLPIGRLLVVLPSWVGDAVMAIFGLEQRREAAAGERALRLTLPGGRAHPGRALGPGATSGALVGG